mgnify:FL=1
MGTAHMEIPVDKVYVVLCIHSRDPYNLCDTDISIESVHRTKKGAQGCVRECEAAQLRKQLKIVLEEPGGYSPELPLSWTYKEMEVKG